MPRDAPPNVRRSLNDRVPYFKVVFDQLSLQISNRNIYKWGAIFIVRPRSLPAEEIVELF